MTNSVFLELQFYLLVLFSVVIPGGIYVFLLKRRSISRWSVVLFSMILIVIAGIDVYLLRSLRDLARASASIIDGRFFSGELSITLYLLPAVFAGIGVNLLSHVLINHLNQAEKKFDQEKRREL